jgi:hypothetical protein
MRDQIVNIATPLIESVGVTAEGLLSTPLRSR